MFIIIKLSQPMWLTPNNHSNSMRFCPLLIYIYIYIHTCACMISRLCLLEKKLPACPFVSLPWYIKNVECFWLKGNPHNIRLKLLKKKKKKDKHPPWTFFLFSIEIWISKVFFLIPKVVFLNNLVNIIIIIIVVGFEELC